MCGVLMRLISINIFRQSRRAAKCESGAALLELALVAPVLVLMAAGIFEFSRVFVSIETLDRSLRASARYLARVPISAVETWGLDHARCLATRGALVPSNVCAQTGECFLFSWCDAAARATIVVDSAALKETAPRVRLSATVPFQFGLLALFGRSAQIRISVAHDEAFIGD